jgi:hypothetical protein
MSPQRMANYQKRLKPFRKQPESNENDTHTQASAAALLLVLTLCLQCAGVAALVEWLRGLLQPRAAKDLVRFARPSW